MLKSRYCSIALIVLIVLVISCSSAPKHITLVPDSSKIVEMDKSKIVLDDGDSFHYGEMGIRVLGMDTPEIAHPEHGFHKDQPFGLEAAAYTADIVGKAKTISYLPYQEDKYGRTLAHVFVDGDLLSTKLIKAGLAYETVSHYGDNGFPKIAAVILEIAKNSETKDFIPPYKWRQQNRDKK